MFVAHALAQEAAAPVAGAPDAMLQFLPIVLIFVVFYFLLIRPQQKKLKQQKDMLAAIRRGDKVVVGGGIIGTVNKVIDDDRVQVEIAEGVRVIVQRQMIASVLAKTEPASNANEPPKGGGNSGATTRDQDAKPSVSSEDKPAGPRPSRLTKILGGKND